MYFNLTEVFNLILHYRYLILFPLLIIEGPIVTVIAAFLASPAYHLLNLYLLFAEVVIADITGDIIYYSIGRFGGTTVILKWGSTIGVTEARFERLKEHYKEHGGKTITAGKIGHGFGWPTMLAAGATRMSFPKFLGINLLVSLLKSLFLVFLGYYYGSNYQSLDHYVHNGGLILSAVLIGLIIFYFGKRAATSK